MGEKSPHKNVSLAPLSMDEALKKALTTKPPEDEPKPRKTEKGKVSERKNA